MEERKIGGITVCMIAECIVKTLIEINEENRRYGRSIDELAKKLFQDKDDDKNKKNVLEGFIREYKAARASKLKYRNMFRNGILEEYGHLIEDYELDHKLRSDIDLLGLELCDKSNDISPQEKKEIIKKNNNIILWSVLIQSLVNEGFNGDKYIESFKKHGKLAIELEKLLNEMYPPQNRQYDPSIIDELKKKINILVITDDRDGLKNIKKAAMKALDDSNACFSLSVRDEVTDEKFDIIYIIYNDGVLSLDVIKEFSDINDQECIKRVFYNSDIKESLNSIMRNSYIEYSDKAVYMLSVIDDVIEIKKKNALISRRLGRRIVELNTLSEQKDKERLIWMIPTGKAFQMTKSKNKSRRL